MRKLFIISLLLLLPAVVQAQSTTNLSITKPQPTTTNWLTTYRGFDQFDAAVAGRLSKSVAGSSDVTLTTTEARNKILEFTGTLTGNINVIVPSKNRTYIIYNNTSGAFTLTVKTAAGTGVAVTQTNRVLLYCDATNVVALTAGGGGTPGGSNTQIQFNDSGAFGGDADLTWDKTNNKLVLTSTANAIGLDIGANGATNPAFRVETEASPTTGIRIIGKAGISPEISVLSPNANQNLTVAAKGSSLVVLGTFDAAAVDNASPGYFKQQDVGAYTFLNAGSVTSGSVDTSIKRGQSGVIGLGQGTTGQNGGTFRAIARTPAQITANQNDYNPGGPSYFQRWSTDASRNITGLTFTDTQVDGQTHLIVNVGSNDIVLTHQDAGSAAGNRFLNSTGANITLSANQAADAIYDATTSRWRVFKRN